MNANDIARGSRLALALDDYRVPPLSAGFADRVLAAAETRTAPLPQLRRSGSGRGWRLGRRIAIGAACFGALATAAAATGVLERFDIAMPSPHEVWASLSSTPAPVVAAAAVPVVRQPDAAATAIAPVVIDGPIDTPEELGEAFRRIDEVRQGRIEARRALTGQRIDRAIDRRRTAGLPVPTPEQEARLRQQIDAAQALRVQRADARIAARRTELARKIDNGEALTREDFAGERSDDPAAAERRARLQDLRAMTPQQRRDTLRNLPPAQRRALIEQYRARRGPAASAAPAPAQEVPAPEADPAVQPAPLPPQG